jgi:hypothetical protein
VVEAGTVVLDGEAQQAAGPLRGVLDLQADAAVVEFGQALLAQLVVADEPLGGQFQRRVELLNSSISTA